MKIRIETDDVIVEVEADTDPAFMGSAAASLSKEASKLFKTAIAEINATGESDA